MNKIVLLELQVKSLSAVGALLLKATVVNFSFSFSFQGFIEITVNMSSLDAGYVKMNLPRLILLGVNDLFRCS